MREKSIKYSREQVLSGLIGKGNGRAFLLGGHNDSQQVEELDQICNHVARKEGNTFWTIIDSEKIKSEKDWCSQYARNLRTSTGASPAQLAKFALEIGKSSNNKAAEDKDAAIEDTPLDILVTTLVNQFSELAEGAPKLLLCIRGLDELNEGILSWLENQLNQAMRNSSAFRNTRFIFTVKNLTERIENFFQKFGFEKVRRFEFPKPVQGKSVTDHLLTNVDSPKAKNAEQESKRLIKEKISSNLKRSTMEGTDKNSAAGKYFSSLSDEHKHFLHLASYPTRISRYTLEHFTDARNSALCFNWLKRQRDLYTLHSSGDLILEQDLRAFAKTSHQAVNPEIASEWEVVSSVLNLFFDALPFQSDHPIAINLQIFSCFGKNLLNSLFSSDELSGIDQFISRNADHIIENESGMTLSDDAKLITRRYMEVSGKLPLTGLEDRVRELWLEDQSKYSKKRTVMDEEKSNISKDIENALQQVTQLKELKENLLENFKNPRRLRPEKVYSFTTSRALLVIGIATVAASLLSENIGSYHAACGLALTVLGFFWPNVEYKTAAAVVGGTNSNLAIETQQRSLKHRISSLCKRIEVMKRNLDDVDEQLLKLGDSPPLPYLEPSSEEESS